MTEACATRGLLLGKTVQRPEAQHQIDGMDSNYRTIRKEFTQQAQRDAVVWVVECRHNHGRV